MARLRFESAPEITVNDESVVFKASNNASAPLIEFKSADGNTVANVSITGVLNVTSVNVTTPANTSNALATRRIRR